MIRIEIEKGFHLPIRFGYFYKYVNNYDTIKCFGIIFHIFKLKLCIGFPIGFY